MAERTAASLVPEVVPVWKERGWINKDDHPNGPFPLTVIDLLKVRSKKLTELIDNAEYFFKDPVSYEEIAAKKQFKSETALLMKVVLDKMESSAVFDAAALEKIYHDCSEQAKIQPGQIIHPTRLAVSGVSFGPGLFELMAVLGKDTVIRRMKKAIGFIETMNV
jgi:glutamyl/glutaminyl-tRNA synthetase